MFIRIKNRRIKLSSIGEYEQGKAISNGQWYLDIKVSGKTRMYYFDTEQELRDIIAYLDKALKVVEV